MGYSGPIDASPALGSGSKDGGIARRLAFWRRTLLGAFALGMVLCALAYGAHWYIDSVLSISTDDAYVDARVAEIAPEIDGTIAEVKVGDTQSVKRGDLLVRLDRADAALSVEQAQANYEQAIRQVQQFVANADGAEAKLAGRRSDLKRAALDLHRRDALLRSGAVSGDEVSTASNAFDNAKSALSLATQDLAAQRALVEGTDVEHNPQVRAAKAMLEKARLDLARTEIRAPIGGIIAQSRVQIGQRARLGAPLMSIVPVSQVYVDANFKEVQLDHIRPGQPVSLTSDLYGPDVVFHGRVAGVGGGTGAAFAVIPAQNATGNWIKVVQRLPVRIALDEKELTRHPLRVGLSMAVTIDLDQPAPIGPGPGPKSHPKAKPKAGPGRRAPAAAPLTARSDLDRDIQKMPAPVLAGIAPATAEASHPTLEAMVPALRTQVSY